MAKAQPPVRYIDNASGLAECESHLSLATEFSFDLEFDNNRYSYGITLCLMQISTDERCFVIDPMTGIDLKGIFRIMEDTKAEKLTFSPDQDLRILHSLGCRPVNLFDIERAGRLLNHDVTGLANLLETKLNYRLDKKLQKSNWNKRPLTEEQIKYSAEDVIHLPELKKLFLREAEEKKILSLLQEENKALEKLSFETKDPGDHLSADEKKTLSPYEQFVMNELVGYADALGRKHNKPLYMVAHRQILLDLTQGKIRIQDWQEVRGLHPAIRNAAFQEHYRKTVHEADARNLPKQTERPQLTHEQREQFRLQRTERETARGKIFEPIKRELTKRYGEYAARFLLSETFINQLAGGTLKLADLNIKYRADLFRSIAAELKINTRGYF